MKAYLDTNILVAASVRAHPHHGPALDLVEAVIDRALAGCISTHGLAEYYSVVTRTPFVPRVHPAEADQFMGESILPYFELVALSADDYKEVLRSCIRAGLIGGVIFDALHVRSAKKAECDRLYTFNVKDFRAVASPDMAGKITAP
jgi:predicted nucleic acid-binding protein